MADSPASGGRTSRSGGTILDADVTFPPMRTYETETKLPSIKSVLCMLRKGGSGNCGDFASRGVAKQVSAKWYHDTVACESLSTITREEEKLRNRFVNGNRRYLLGEKYQNEKVLKE